MAEHEHEWWWYGRTDGSDGYWFCDQCNAEYRPTVDHPTPDRNDGDAGG